MGKNIFFEGSKSTMAFRVEMPIIPGHKKRLHISFFLFVKNKKCQPKDNRFVPSPHPFSLPTFFPKAFWSSVTCSDLDPWALPPVSMTAQSLSLFSMGGIQWRQVTVLCNKVNFLVSFLFIRLSETLSLARLRKEGKKKPGDEWELGPKFVVCKGRLKNFGVEQQVISPQVFVFLYILKIILPHFSDKVIPYFLLFTLVIANTTPVLVFQTFVSFVGNFRHRY